MFSTVSFYHWHSRQKEAFSRTSLGYTVFLQFLSSLWESQHCCCTLGVCFLLLFYQTCGAKRGEWRVWWKKNLCVNLPESASEMRRKIDCKPQCAHTVDVGKWTLRYSHIVYFRCSFSKHYRVMTQRAVDNLRTCLSKGFSSPRQCHT